MARNVPRWLKTTEKQIEWYQEQLDLIHKLPVRHLKVVHGRLREHYLREIDLLTREVEHEYQSLTSTK